MPRIQFSYSVTWIEGTSAIGRLDKDTTGLLLLSNDGDFNNGIRLKSRGIIKEYEITVTEVCNLDFLTIRK